MTAALAQDVERRLEILEQALEAALLETARLRDAINDARWPTRQRHRPPTREPLREAA